MKISISKKIISLAVVPLILLILVSSIGSSILLGSATIDEVEKQLKLAVYAIQKETEQMSAQNTKMETVDSLINDFKEKNGIDITIFGGNIRLFSTVSNAINTPMDDMIWGEIREGDYYFSKNANVAGAKYYAYYVPVMQDGECVGAFFAGEPAERVDGMILMNMANMAMMTIVVGILTTISSAIVAKRISRKIEKIKVVLGTLNENDLSQDHKKYGFEGDEIEEINNNTVDFSQQLRNIIGTIKETSNGLKNIASDLNTNVQFTNDSCIQISQAIENVASGAVSQAEDTSSAAQNISDMSNELGKIKTNTDDLHSIANSMDSAKNNVMNTLCELQKVTKTMIEDVNSTSSQVDATSKSVEQIKRAVEVIQDIANQTNLLSLNASIEASHAGEHGKGFSVVAEEIGKLANQSKESSNEIESILAQLVKNYDVIIQNVKSTSDNMNIQNSKLIETQKVFHILENDINGTVKRISEINTMIDYLSNEIDKVVDMISNLSAISQENSASTEQTMAAIQELNGIVEQVAEKAQNIDKSADVLMKEVNVFKTE